MHSNSQGRARLPIFLCSAMTTPTSGRPSPIHQANIGLPEVPNGPLGGSKAAFCGAVVEIVSVMFVELAPGAAAVDEHAAFAGKPLHVIATAVFSGCGAAVTWIV